MNSADLTQTWTVRISNFPIAEPGESVGIVHADTKADAQKKAEDLYGRKVIVERTERLNRSDYLRSAPPRLTKSTIRAMAPDEITMARAVACCRWPGRSDRRSAMRMLAAESHKLTPAISGEMAEMLRACVQAFAAQLPAKIVDLAATPI